MSDTTFQKLPNHVGIIMDGNGRWARSLGKPRIAGHRAGAKTVDRIVTACRKRGIKTLTLYAFSSQNWHRPSLEVQALMQLLGEYIKKERRTILDNNIKLTAIGQLELLPKAPKEALEELIKTSSSNQGMTLCLALSYGGKEEIVHAAKTLCQQVCTDQIHPTQIDEKTFESALWSSHLGPVDLVIRTSGELRLSNFLLWSCAYAEFYFSEKMWPEFVEEDLDNAFREFSNRKRRFGELDK